MKRTIYKTIIVIILMTNPLINVEADTNEDFVIVYLKSNGRLEGLIREEDNEKIVLEMGFGTTQILKTDIYKIEYPVENEKNLIAREYQKHVEDVENNIRNRDVNKKKFNERIEEKIKAIDESTLKDTVIPFSNSSSIFVDVVINGEVGVNLLVDTGASFVVISPKLAEKLNVSPKKDAKEIELKIADGSMIKGMPVILDSIKVKDVSEENVKAVIAESGELAGILGMSFLNKFHLNLDPDRKELTLREK